MVAACSITAGHRRLDFGPLLEREFEPKESLHDRVLDVSAARAGRCRMSRPLALLVMAIVLLSALVAAGPTLVGLANVLPTLVLALGLGVALLRLVWFYTTGRSS